MKVAIAAIVAVLIIVAIAAYGALHTRPQAGEPLTATTTVGVVATTTPVTTTETPTTPAPSTVNATYGTSKTLALGQTARFADGYTITPVSVVEDSRCGIDVVCIQAGTVRVAVKVTSGDTTRNEVLTLGKTVAIADRSVSFTSVSPSRRSDQSIGSGDYRFIFNVTKSVAVSQKCYVGGCSGQICSDQPGMASTCEYRSEYACYKTAKCERQSTGQCGWTPSTELTSCLAANR